MIVSEAAVLFAHPFWDLGGVPAGVRLEVIAVDE